MGWHWRHFDDYITVNIDDISAGFGAGGFITAFNAKGVNGSGYGAGGGPTKVNGGNADVAGGDGSQGLVIVWEYA